eukprot:Gb_19473 [translate_table: standard]
MTFTIIWPPFPSPVFPLNSLCSGCLLTTLALHGLGGVYVASTTFQRSANCPTTSNVNGVSVSSRPCPPQGSNSVTLTHVYNDEPFALSTPIQQMGISSTQRLEFPAFNSTSFVQGDYFWTRNDPNFLQLMLRPHHVQTTLNPEPHNP